MDIQTIIVFVLYFYVVHLYSKPGPESEKILLMLLVLNYFMVVQYFKTRSALHDIFLNTKELLRLEYTDFAVLAEEDQEDSQDQEDSEDQEDPQDQEDLQETCDGCDACEQ